MALSINITSDQNPIGGDLTGAYVKVTRIEAELPVGTYQGKAMPDKVTVILSYFTSKEARDENKNPIAQKTLSLSDAPSEVRSGVLTWAYETLKLMPEFQDAVDEID